MGSSCADGIAASPRESERSPFVSLANEAAMAMALFSDGHLFTERLRILCANR